MCEHCIPDLSRLALQAESVETKRKERDGEGQPSPGSETDDQGTQEDEILLEALKAEKERQLRSELLKWRKKRYRPSPVPPPPRNTWMDFSFENPLDGLFKDMNMVEEMMREFRGRVFRRDTSYCHYGYDYRKRTVFISSIRNFNPKQACQGNPCEFFKKLGKHPRGVVDCGSKEKNSIPAPLVEKLLGSWMQQNPDAEKFLVVDVFAGYGSVPSAVAQLKRDDPAKWGAVAVFTNDIATYRGAFEPNSDLDMLHADPLALLHLAVFGGKLYPEAKEEAKRYEGDPLAWAKQEKLAVLFHCSTPCTTYSVDGMAHHRETDGRPKTIEALEADVMNERLIAFFYKYVLSPDARPSELGA